MNALNTQLVYELDRLCVSYNSIESVFIGGGTPSSVEASLYKDIFKTLKPYLKENIEITSEANPNSATLSWLDTMFDLGVNRISFGVQSFNDDKLKFLNRAHNSKVAKEAILNANRVGFKNISLDLIYATIKDNKTLLKNDLDEAFLLPINHLSAYALTIESNTPFEKKPFVAKEELDITKWLFKEIESRGFKQYEISNFGIYNSTHNLGYWNYKDYIGIGAGAVGKFKNKRFYPTRDIEQYIKDPLKIDVEILDNKDIVFEKIFLGFRSVVGVDKSLLSSSEYNRAKILVDEKKLEFKNSKFYNYNFLLADELALFLMD